MNRIGVIFFIAIFFGTTTRGCLRACNTRETRNTVNSRTAPRRLNALEMEAFKHMFLSKMGMTRPPTREEVANSSAAYRRNFEVTDNGNSNASDSSDHHAKATTFRDVISFMGKGEF